MKTIYIVAATVALTAAGIYGGHRWYNKGSAVSETPATKVRMGKVIRGDLAEVVQAPGALEPKNKVSISAQVAARVVEVPYPEGSRVTKGDANTSASLLVRLDDTELEATLRSAQARYSAQKAQIKASEMRMASSRSQLIALKSALDQTRREFEREKSLLATRNTSQQAYDQAKRALDERQAQYDAALHGLDADRASLESSSHTLEAAGAEIARAEEGLRYANIVSPIDGVVTRVNAKVGELVMTGTMNNAGTVIMDVADLSQMLLIARVDEADIAAVKEGQPAIVHMQAFPDRDFKGVVTKVSLASVEKEKEKNFTAEILVETNGAKLPSGLSGDVDIETSRHTGVLKVPSQAVLGREMETLHADVRKQVPESMKANAMAIVVCTRKNNKVVVKPVEIGPSDATHTIIKSGVSEGDPIIVGPFKVLEKLEHDAKVEDDDATTSTAKSDSETTK